ncbi:MAG: ABC transporter ATP-binding protein [Candidatus Thermoplasmatota archaeon]|nr:ABC transporter ATP-binding protein [Candidatus Thermoplasmatota archaeon]MCL5793538.1 ABC transporter ATP-binding protein [Candidatus Thermoplasmatota archaeon]
MTGFIGLNGAGKTTTIRIMAGLLEPDSGNIIVDGLDLRREKPLASEKLGLVPDQSYFDPGSRAGDLLEYMASFYSQGTWDRRDLSNSLLRKVGLLEERDRRLGKFSLGMAKRFAIAASLVNSPRNIIFDEVLNGLDPAGMKMIREIILEMRKDGCSILLSTHALAELEGIADRMVVIHRGRIIGELLPEDMYAHGGNDLTVRIENPGEDTERVLTEYGKVSAVGRNFRIRDANIDAPELNAELIRRGYRVSSISRENGSLENAFLRLIEKVDQKTQS